MSVTPSRRRALRAGLLAGVLPVLLVLALGRTQGWRGFEERAEGLLRASAGGRAWHPGLTLVAIDEASLHRMRGRLDRASLGRLIEALSAAGVRAIALDFLLTREEPGEGSDALARAVAASARVSVPLSCELSDTAPAEAGAQPKADALSAAPPGTFPCRGATLPRLPLTGGANLSHVVLGPSASGNARSVRLAVQVGESAVPSLALATWMLGEGLPRSAVQVTEAGLRVGARLLPFDRHGAALPHWYPLEEAPLLSMDSLLGAMGDSEPARLPPELAASLAGHLVLVGFTAPEVGDLGPLANGEIGPKMLVHAAFLSDLLEGDTLEDLTPLRQALAALLVGGLLLAAALWLRPPVASLAALVLVPAVLALTRAGVSQGVVLGPVEPLAAGLLGFAGALAGRLLVEGRERAVLVEAFGAYVDRRMLEQLLHAPERSLSLEGQQRDVSVLFCDVSGYTGLSNALPAPQVIALVREYLEAMSQVISEHGGRVDKMMGDGVMSVFGDPLPLPEHATRAVECALAMQERMRHLRVGWEARGLPPLHIRIGVATGEVYVGNVGSRRAKLEYTVLGPTVNLASRLEGQAPRGGVLVSSTTRERCADRFAFTAVEGLRLKGYDAPYTAWSVSLCDSPEQQAG